MMFSYAAKIPRMCEVWTKMKKLMLLMTRKDMEDVLRELVLLRCVEVAEPDSLLEDPELAALLKRETVKLDSINSNVKSFVMLGTQYTLLMTGWVPTSLRDKFVDKLSYLPCAWELDDLSPDELDIAPVVLRCPGFLTKYRLAGRKQFEPLMQLITQSG